MKNLIITTVLTASLLFGNLAYSQIDPTLQSQLEAMKKMHVMEGNWKGEGWIQKGQSERELFSVKENVSIKNNGVTLLVEGMGTNATTNEIVHDALAIIYYDVQAQTYKFDSHLAKGMHKLATGQMDDNMFIWGFGLPNNAKIRYTLTFTDNSWNEIGEYTPDQTNWYKFLEMNLTKQQ